MNIDVDALAQEIRRVDGSHSLGAGALAEALAPYIRALSADRGEAVATVGDLCFDAAERVCEHHKLSMDTPLYATPPSPADSAEGVAAAFERECADIDRILDKLGLGDGRGRTDGGSLHVPRILNHIQETLDALAEASNRAAHFTGKRQSAESAAPSQVSMARALQWHRELANVREIPEAIEHLPAIEEAIAAYDPATAGARTARQPQPGRVEGMVLVPVEPTPEMVRAAYYPDGSDAPMLARVTDRIRKDWRAMIAAAPTAGGDA